MAIKNISLPDDMLAKVENEANTLGITFSDFIKLLISKEFNGLKFEVKSNNNKKVLS